MSPPHRLVDALGTEYQCCGVPHELDERRELLLRRLRRRPRTRPRAPSGTPGPARASSQRAALALVLERLAAVPHVLVDDQLLAALEQVQQRRRARPARRPRRSRRPRSSAAAAAPRRSRRPRGCAPSRAPAARRGRPARPRRSTTGGRPGARVVGRSGAVVIASSVVCAGGRRRPPSDGHAGQTDGATGTHRRRRRSGVGFLNRRAAQPGTAAADGADVSWEEACRPRDPRGARAPRRSSSPSPRSSRWSSRRSARARRRSSRRSSWPASASGSCRWPSRSTGTGTARRP